MAKEKHANPVCFQNSHGTLDKSGLIINMLNELICIDINPFTL